MTEPEPMPDAEVPKWLRDDEREVVRAECVRYRPRNTTDDERHPYLDWCEVLCRRMAEARKELAEVPKRGASIAGLSKRFQDAYREHWDIQSCHCVQCDALRELAESKRREQDANEHAADFGADMQRLERERDAEAKKREVAEGDARNWQRLWKRKCVCQGELIAEVDGLQEEVDAFKCASMLVGHSGDPADITPGAVEKHITELREAESERDALLRRLDAATKGQGALKAEVERLTEERDEDLAELLGLFIGRGYCYGGEAQIVELSNARVWLQERADAAETEVERLTGLLEGKPSSFAKATEDEQ